MNKFIKIFRSLIILCVLLTFGKPPLVSAQAQSEPESRPGPTIQVRLDPEIRRRYVPPPAVFLQRLSGSEQAATATIAVNYNGDGWTAEAQTAFEYAADIWETLITSPVPIVVDAQFGPMDPGVLGGAGPTMIWGNFTNAPQANTWYPVATANKLANTDLNPGLADINATFSSSYSDWHFGTGNSTPTNKISFVSVVLHELGHGLGFIGSMRVDDGVGQPECQGPAGRGCYGYDGYPMIYDRYTENGVGTLLLNFSNNSTELGSQLTSNNIYFDSSGGNFANGGIRVPIFAPSTWSPGSSYSHLGEGFNSTAHALMTFSISKGETIHNPGSVTLCMFAEMGWTVGQSCGTTAISGLAASNDGPTVLGNPTRMTATIINGSNVIYAWDFGDGGTGSGAVVSHQYASAGTFTAEVTATNSLGQATASTQVQVDESVTAISGLKAANDGPTIFGNTTQLTATISAGSGVAYAWDFGDGTSGTGQVTFHKYAAAGNYLVEVTATNTLGKETATTNVQVLEITSRIYIPMLVKP
jgi:PKD repeat protein